jgi:hypothetical protein
VGLPLNFPLPAPEPIPFPIPFSFPPSPPSLALYPSLCVTSLATDKTQDPNLITKTSNTSPVLQRKGEKKAREVALLLCKLTSLLPSAETQAARERAFPLHNLLLVLLHRQAPQVSNLFSNIYTRRRFDCSRVSGMRILGIKVSSVR